MIKWEESKVWRTDLVHTLTSGKFFFRLGFLEAHSELGFANLRVVGNMVK